MRYKSRTRALAASALAASLGLAGLAFTASPAQASEDTDVVRVAGTTRYGTAADAATSAYPAGSANVVLASGEKFPDALAGGGLAGSLDAPILLTQENALPAETTAALAELDAETVTILGGTSAVSAAVETALETAGYTVDRVGGADRFETAALIAEELGGTTAVLANGLRFPDALAISPGAHALELPLLLTTVDGLHEDAAAYIDGNAVDSVIIVGGTAVVSQATEDALEADGITVTRLAGATRYESSIEIAEFHVTQGFTLAEVVMATGENFPDALAGGPYASQLGAPMVLTQTATLTPSVATWLAENCQAIDALSILGGTAAITTAVETAAAAAAQCDTNASFGATPGGDQVVALGAGGSGGTRDFTFTGVGDGPVDVALVPCYDDEIQDNGGTFSFLDQDEDNRYDQVGGGFGDTRMGNAQLISVNSEPADSTTFDDNAAVEGGTVTVRVRSTDVECVRILVWDDADDDDALDLNSANEPSEAFGITGMLVWHNGEAPAGTDPHDYIVYIDKDADFFVLEDGFLYNYDSGDIFGYDDVDPEDQITMAEFELAANNNDSSDEIDMQSTFGYTTTGQNRYALDHEVSNIPTGLTVGTSGNLDGDADAADTPFSWMAPDPLNGLIEDYTVDIYTNAGQVDCDSGAYVMSATSTSTATTVTAEDLGDGAFCAVVYASTFDGSSSYDSEPVRFVVDTGQAPIITSAALTSDAVTEGEADTGDVWTLVFNEEMNPATVAGATFTLTDVDGDSILVECKVAAADAVTDATCVLGNGADATVANDTLVITLAEDATDRNIAGDTFIEYPLTITAVTGLTDLNDSDTVNVAGSTDLTIG